MKAFVKKSILKGSITAPPSKSFLHRMLICAALSEGRSVIANAAQSEDILATIDGITNFGASVVKSTEAGGCNVFAVETGEKSINDAVFNCRESGSTLRFLVPLALIKCEKAVFTGSPRLMERGISIYEDILSDRGAVFKRTLDGIEITGTLEAGEYTIPGNISSQYITGLMFALPLLTGKSKIKVVPPVESRAYIDITVAALKKAGIIIDETENNTFEIEGSQKYIPLCEEAEGDWSNAAFLYALKAAGHDIDIKGLSSGSIQGDRICTDYFEKLSNPGAVLDISDCIDLGPVLFAFAALNNGGTFTGTERLKIKESDRAGAMAEELKKAGVEVKITDNSVTVGQCSKMRSAEVFGHNDHRIVMALTVLLLFTGGVIDGIEAVAKSYPHFFDDLKALGACITFE